MSRRKRTARPKLSPAQFIKGSIIRLGLAKKVKVRDAKPGADGNRGARIQFQFIWHRLVLLFAVLLVLGWASAATAGYIFVRVARDFPEVRFVDIAFPHRWDHYHTALGDYYIEQAKERLEKGEMEGVLQYIRVGVEQSPGNTEGRLMLAGIYNVIGRPDLGIDLLQAKVEENQDNLEYLNTLISMLLANHEDAAVEELAERLLAGSTEPTERNLVLALAAATASFNRGNYDRAQEIINQFDLMESRTGTVLQARVHWDLGESDKAISLLERVLQNPGTLEEKVVDYLIEYLWQSGRQDRAYRVTFERFINDPLSFAPRVRLLYVHNKRGEAAKEREEIETYFELFGKDESAMSALAGFAAQTGNPELAERVYQHVRSHQLASADPAISLVEARVEAGEYGPALEFYNKIEDEVEDWTPLQQARLQPLLAVAYLGAGEVDRGDGILKELLVLQRGANPAWLMSLADRLVEMGRSTRARNVLSHIHLTQPLNQEALTKLIQVDLDQGNNDAIVRNIELLLKMRKPSPTVLENAHAYISSDQFLFQPGRDGMLQSLEAAIVTGQSRDS